METRDDTKLIRLIEEKYVKPGRGRWIYAMDGRGRGGYNDSKRIEGRTARKLNDNCSQERKYIIKIYNPLI